MEKTDVIIVFPGSFNPPTNGHLFAMRSAFDFMKSKGFNVITTIMVPTNSKYSKSGLLDGEIRLKMCNALADSTDFVEVKQIFSAKKL